MKNTYRLKIWSTFCYPDGPYETPTEFETPMDAMSAITQDSAAGYLCERVECYRYADGIKQERQWLFIVD